MKRKYAMFFFSTGLLYMASLQGLVVSADTDLDVENISNVFIENLEEDASTYWDNVSWSFSAEGVLTIQGGTIDLNADVAPWRSGLISPTQIKEINFVDTVYLKGNASTLFVGLTNLEKINVEHLNVDEVTNMSAMFLNLSKVAILDVSHWNVSNVTNMSLMFSGVSSLKSIDLSNWNTRNALMTMGMFRNTLCLTEITLGMDTIFKQDIMIDSIIEEYSSRLIGKNTGKIYVSSFDLVTNYDGTNPDTFVKEKIQENYWGTASYEFNNGFLTIAGGTIDLANDITPWASQDIVANEIKYISFEDTVYLKGDASYLFTGLVNLMNVELEKLDVSQVTSMKGMFLSSKLSRFNLSNWDTSNVTDMSYMFNAVQSVREIDLENWNTSNVKTMSYMFTNATFLQNIYLSQWDVSNVSDVSYMFAMTPFLEQINISTWDLNAKNTNGMFLGSKYK